MASPAALSCLVLAAWTSRPAFRPPSPTALRRAVVRLMPEPITDESEAPVAQWEPPQVDAAALTVGQLVPCTVIEQLESGAYSVNIGASSPAVLPRNEVFLRPNRTAGSREIGRGFGVLPVGFSFQAQVTALADGKVNVSLARAQRTIAWTRCAQLADDDVTLAAKVLRFGPAGATLAVENLPAFLPWSAAAPRRFCPAGPQGPRGTWRPHARIPGADSHRSHPPCLMSAGAIGHCRHPSAPRPSMAPISRSSSSR